MVEILKSSTNSCSLDNSVRKIKDNMTRLAQQHREDMSQPQSEPEEQPKPQIQPWPEKQPEPQIQSEPESTPKNEKWFKKPSKYVESHYTNLLRKVIKKRWSYKNVVEAFKK